MKRHKILAAFFFLIFLFSGMSAYSQFQISSVTTDALSCRAGYGRILVTTQNRTGDVFYGLYNQPPFPPPGGLITYDTTTLNQDNAIFSEVLSGNYFVVAVDLTTSDVKGQWINISTVQTKALTADPIFVSKAPSCYGTPDAELTAQASGGNPPYTYTWTPGSVPGQVLTGVGFGVYQVEINDSYNCDTAKTSVGPPSINIESYAFTPGNDSVPGILSGGTITASDPSVCNGLNPGIINNTTTPSGGSNNYSYDWESSTTGGAPWTSLGVSALSYDPPVLAQTTTFRRVTSDACGIVNSNEVIITVNPLPLPTASSNSPVCEGETLALTGGPGGMTSYSWTGPNSYTSNQQSPTVSPTATAAMAGIYNLTVVDGNGCTNAANTNVAINLAPTPSAVNDGPACVGEALNLSGAPGGMTSYLWTGPNSFTSNQQSPNVSPSATSAMAGLYTLTVVDGNGCSNSANTTAVVNALPLVTASSNTPVCIGESLDLIGGPAGMTTYTWTGPNGFSSNQQSPNVSLSATAGMAGSYTLTIVDGNGCTNAINTSVVVNSLPIPIASSNSPVCVGESLDLTGAPGSMASYSWAGPNGFSSSLQSPNVSGSATAVMAGLYTLTVIDGNGCTNAANTNVVVNALPIVTASNNGPVCEGQALNLIGGPVGMASYSWTGPNSFSSSAQSPNVSPSATLAMAGIYTLTVVDVNGCSAAANTSAVVNSLPAVTASSNSPVCVGESLDLVGGPAGMTSYTWAGPNAFSSNQQSPNVSASATNAMAGIYTLTIVDASGCSNATNTTVVVNNLPIPVASSNSPVCVGESLDLTGADNGMTSYAWTGPNGFTSSLQSPNVSPSATVAMAGLYTLTVVDGNACSNSDNTNVIVNTLPIVTASNNGPVCEGESLDLIGGPVGMASYSWTGPNSFTSSVQSPNVSPSATNAMAGVYTLVVVDGNTCSNTANTTAVVNPLPLATASSNSPVCVGESLDLIGGPTGMTSYSWTGPNAFSSNQQSPNVSGTATAAMAGLYTLTVVDGNGCSAIASTPTVVNTLPLPVASSNSPVCVGESLDLAGAPGGMTSYSWTGPDSFSSNLQSPNVSASATAAMAGLYTLVVVDGNGCTNSANTNVIVNALPLATASNNGPVCESESLNLTGGPVGMASYTWTGPNSFASALQSPNVSPSATPAMAGLYTLTIVDGNGCSNLANTTAVVNPLPIVTATNNSPICEGESLDLTGGPGGMASYAWSGPNAFTSNQQSPNVSGTATATMAGLYTLTVVDGNGCTNVGNTIVAINSIPSVTIVPDPGSTCTDQDLPLSGFAIGGSGTYDTYSWTGTGAVHLDLTNSPFPVFNSSTSGTFGLNLTVADDNGCEGSSSTTVNVIAAPTASAGPDTSLCAGGDYRILDADTANSNGIIWVTMGDGFFDNNSIIDPLYTPGTSDVANGSVKIVIRASGYGSCSIATDTAIISLPEPVQAFIGAPAPFLIGANTEIEVCLSTTNHQFIEDLGFYLRSPDNQIFMLKRGILETNFFSPPCFNFLPNGNVTDLCFTTELPLSDTLDLCTEPIPVNGNFAATGDWSNLFGMNPAEAGWALAINDTADFGTGGIDGEIINATITFIDTAIATGVIASVDYISGPILEPIVDDKMNFINIQRDLQVSCPDACDAIALVNVIGGTPPYAGYTWSPLPAGGNGTDSVVLCAGTYDLTVIDALGCEGTASVNVLSPPAINIDEISYTDTIACAGDTTGVVVVKASGGTGTLVYSLMPGGIPSEAVDSGYFTGLAAGSYTVHIEDGKTCGIDSIISIVDKAPLVLETAIVTDSVFCSGDTNGRIAATASGGTKPYSFILEPLALSNDSGIFENLAPGSYVVRLTDANDCDTLNSDTLILGVPIVLAIDTVMVDSIACEGELGRLTVVTSGGAPPYYVSVTGGPDSVLVGPITTLTLRPNAIDAKDVFLDSRMPDNNYGTYREFDAAAWTDGGIPFDLRALIDFDLSTIPSGSSIVSASLALYAFDSPGNGSHSNMSGSNEALLQRITTPWEESSVTWNSQPSITNLNEVLIPSSTDAHQNYPNIDVTNIVQDMIDDPANSYGMLFRLVTEEHYRKMIFGSSDNVDISLHPKLVINYAPTGSANIAYFDVPAGSYDIIVYDSKGCTDAWPETIVLNDPPAINVDAIVVTHVDSCYNHAQGAIDITISGGVSPYEFSLDGSAFQSSGTFTNLFPGSYNVYYRDSKGCLGFVGATVNGPPPIYGNIGPDDVKHIQGDSLGSIQVNASGGTPYTIGEGYRYSLNGLPSPPGTNDFFPDLSSGLYNVHIEDSLGCTWDSIIVIIELEIDMVITIEEPSCYGTATGRLIFNSTDIVFPYDIYNLHAADTIIDLNVNYIPYIYNNVRADTFELLVIDATGRTYDSTFIVGSPPLIIPDPLIVQPSCAEFELPIGSGAISENGSISITTTGGTGDFSYAWSHSTSIDSVQTGLMAGNYSVTVTDGLDCSVSQTISLAGAEIIAVNIGIGPNPPINGVSPTYPGDTAACYLTPFRLYASHGGSNASYLWEPDSLLNDPGSSIYGTVDITVRGDYQYMVTVSTSSCYDFDVLAVEMLDTIGMHITAEATRLGDSLFVPIDVEVPIFSSDGFASYIWNPTLDLNLVESPLNQNNIMIPYNDGILRIMGTTSEGCNEYDTVYVVLQKPILDVPTVFTPNNDGYNDLWEIHNTIGKPDLEILIFNRWGQQLFYSKTYGNDRYNTWDGKSQTNGKDLPAGTYYYVIKPNDGEQEPITGTVTIVR